MLFADFDWDTILEMLSTKPKLLEPIPKYPEVTRDFALLVDEDVSFEGLRNAAFQTEKKLLKKIFLNLVN